MNITIILQFLPRRERNALQFQRLTSEKVVNGNDSCVLCQSHVTRQYSMSEQQLAVRIEIVCEGVNISSCPVVTNERNVNVVFRYFSEC